MATPHDGAGAGARGWAVVLAQATLVLADGVTGELVRRKEVNRPVPETLRACTPRAALGEVSTPQKLCEPAHMAIAVDGVRDEIERRQ